MTATHSWNNRVRAIIPDGPLFGSDDDERNCWGWTSNSESGSPIIGHSWPRQLNGTDQNGSHWIYAHNQGPNISGCNRNINVTDSMESGHGGEGGYGAWYCFAVTTGLTP